MTDKTENTNMKQIAKNIVLQALEAIAAEKNVAIQINETNLIMETPPNPDMGDIGFPLFPFAKALRMGPPQIAEALLEKVKAIADTKKIGIFRAVGPYLNLYLNKASSISSLLQSIEKDGSEYGSKNTAGEKPLANQNIMLEFSSPNTNKPLHLGHLRNDALGESVSRILKKLGANVFKVNIINDRGVHICKSMLAYEKFHRGKTPESLNVKSDRFVGDCYVDFNNYAKTNPQAEEEAQKLLRKWEAEDKEVTDLWKTMNTWAFEGIKETYERTNVSFDKFYFESQTYLKGKEEILKGLEEGLFYKDDDGAIWIDLEEIKLDKKVLLRKDGTALYITQDIGTAIERHQDWPFDQLVYVVGNEQIYHFKVLFYVLEKLGFNWAKQLYHLSYGMVNLPEGKMKSREGTVVDADDLIDSLRDDALAEIREKGRETEVGDAKAVAEKIALGALHYFLLQVSASKDMIFDPKESLSFNGNTGPYLQYMGARISSILKKAEKERGNTKPQTDDAVTTIDTSLLSHAAEWELAKHLELFPESVEKAGRDFDPSIIAIYAYDLAKLFSRFYHDCPILQAENKALSEARLALVQAVKEVLMSAMDLILVPFLETM